MRTIRLLLITSTLAFGIPFATADVGIGNNAWFYPVGLALTGHRDDAGDRLLLGIDASAIWMSRRHRWIGPTADLTAAPSGGLTELGIGGAAGSYVLGADLSYVLGHEDGRWVHGVRGRALLTFGIVGFHVGYVARIGADDAVEAGLLIKYPFPLEP